jgi:hypothetical protein
MSQKVKLQMSSDIEDVTKLSSVTLTEALTNVTRLSSIITDAKNRLWACDISSEEDRKSLADMLSSLDDVRLLLSKIDMRIGDVASIISGLSSIFEQPNQEEQKEDNNDSVNTG